jgi:tRNA 2-thiouridine synthesizing protein A
MADQERVLLDAKGLRCPMPLLKAKQAINQLEALEMLEVRATDPGSVRDFEVFSKQSGHALLESRQDGDTYIYVLQKKAG